MSQITNKQQNHTKKMNKLEVCEVCEVCVTL